MDSNDFDDDIPAYDDFNDDDDDDHKNRWINKTNTGYIVTSTKCTISDLLEH